MRYRQEFFYSLKEVNDALLTGTYPFSDSTSIEFYDLLDALFAGAPDEAITGINVNEFKVQGSPLQYGLLHILWVYLFNRYQDEFVGFGDIENPTSTDLVNNQSIQRTFRFILDVMVNTYPRYKKILDLYTAEKDHLMDDVKNYVKFNDTPQNLTSLPSNAEFITNYTEYSNEFTTKMARIKEIERDFANVMNDWCNEFHNIFIEV